VQLIQFENNIFTSFSQDAMAVRQLLSLDKETDTGMDCSAGTHVYQMLEMFVFYRVLDLLAVVEGIAGLVSVPKQIKLANLGPMEKIVCFDNLCLANC
jgi:hypothetical protein